MHWLLHEALVLARRAGKLERPMELSDQILTLMRRIDPREMLVYLELAMSRRRIPSQRCGHLHDHVLLGAARRGLSVSALLDGRVDPQYILA